MIEGRRGRRQGRALLPLRRVANVVDVSVNLSNTVSCWYCDWKTSYLNKPVFSFGRSHSRFLKLWFSVGMGFGLTTLFGISMILILELARALHLYNGNLQFSVLSGSFFGVYSSILEVRISAAAVGYMCLSSVISVCAHEFGHALAAASEGIQMEYTAVFLAVLFPGALIAFSHELLQELPRFATLRIYCAGIWHNATLCVVCALTLVLLPFILYPFYIHGESPMVMDVSSESPLSSYLSPGDLVVSLDGNPIHSAGEWTEMAGILSDQTLQNSQYYSGRKGYCIPGSMIGESTHRQLIDNQTTCENELLLFEDVSCAGSSMLNDSRGENNLEKRKENVYCVTPKNVLNLKRCGDGWVNTIKDKSSCSCLKGSCLTPVKLPGLTWVEITYSSPYSPGCWQLRRESNSSDKSLDMEEISCGGTFIFLGDLISMANSVLLTSYQPRWLFVFGAYIPSLLEKLLMYTFHVSLMLALLNGLPIYFEQSAALSSFQQLYCKQDSNVYHLDGESILETSLCCFSFLTPRQRDIILRSCLLGGTLLSIILIARIFLVAFVS